MKYVALLRGINVGGKNRVEMQRLKAFFETVGMEDVQTYINSGNVIFSHAEEDTGLLADIIEQAIEKEFSFVVKTIVRSENELRATVQMIRDEWGNNADMKCDVLFLWDTLTPDELLEQLKPHEDIDEVRQAPGAVIWKVDRKNASRSGLMRIMGTPAYKQVTVRNCNTVRRLVSMMKEGV